MPVFPCPSCRKPIDVSTTDTHATCPQCGASARIPRTSATRWYYLRDKKKHGPFTWGQLVTLAKRGTIKPDDMLQEEGSKQWVAARSLPALFAHSKPKRSSSRGWVTATLTGVAALSVCVFVPLVGIASWYLVVRNTPTQHVQEKGIDKKPIEKPQPKKIDGLPKPKDEKKQAVEPKASTHAAPFVAKLNVHRKNAGIGPVTLDDDLSRGCQAHADYLAQYFDPDQPELGDEDPKKPGYSDEGNRAAQASIIAFADPEVILEHWMGRLLSRVPLLNPQVQSVGVGFAKTRVGWVCVLDPSRGLGDRVVVFPSPKQTDVPTAFSAGQEVAEMKGAAGFPVTVTFPRGKSVRQSTIELRDAKGNALDSWRFTPEKPWKDPDNRNTIAFIPKGLLASHSTYHVKASAQVDGKAWSSSWSFTTDDDSDRDGVWAKKALERVNQYRANAGLKPVELDATLSEACLKHARYLVINEGHKALEGLGAHSEDLSLPGASEEGKDAGIKSNIGIGDYEPTDGVDSWLATLYHRVPVLEPNLRKVGFACARGRRQAWVTVMNITSGRDKGRPHAVFYPAPDQTGVPLHFPNGGETPNPIPEDTDGRAGYPITAFFPGHEIPTKTTGMLTDAQGKEIACWFSSAEKVANPAFGPHQGNAVCLIPKDPLVPNSTYHVRLQGTLRGAAWNKQWKFTTGDGGLSETVAIAQAVERLNVWRARAGLAPVTLDDELSRACQLHAHYMVKNADVLTQRKASVNDEDPLLPGYTAEGRRAAKQSYIFTNAPIPVMQIDDLIASFSTRISLLEPTLERVGYGCALDVGRGWRCVLDINGGRGASRVLVYPAPKQTDVPLAGFDAIPDAKGDVGFPITVTFPRQANLKKAQAVVTSDGKDIEVYVSSPEKPLNKAIQHNTVGVHPLQPLAPGRTYSVAVSVIVDAREWRQTWQFTTRK